MAGKALVEKELVQMTHYLTAKERQSFKVLTAINSHSMNEVIRRAVNDYIELHKDKLPRGSR